MVTFFDGFYQLGFVARDLDGALRMLGERYAVLNWRRKSTGAWAESGHAYVGDLMIEVIAITGAAPAIYQDYLPVDSSAIRLHHHGFLIADQARWNAINTEIDRRGIATDLRGEVMGGDLKFLYADTRAEIGIYSEYVMLSGSASAMYDDVPRN